jgi:hypothetical protein
MLTQDAPEIVILWDRQPTARKEYRCDCCGDPLPAGERYSSVGLREDGEFRHKRTHLGSWRYPSGCPRIGARDRADEQAQFERDQQLFRTTKGNHDA